MNKPYYLRVAKMKITRQWHGIPVEYTFDLGKSFGIHVYGDNKRDVIAHLELQGYVVLGSAQMVYVPQDKDEGAYL